ncbi:glucoamylase family protein [Sphingobacterium sp. HJSM2_6]|uniref:glucoamylase family protein n=1 Tax=Sphingobacterium sp. HJSM2_6 TaxID=3366264 RepID=UPI003BC58A80
MRPILALFLFLLMSCSKSEQGPIASNPSFQVLDVQHADQSLGGISKGIPLNASFRLTFEQALDVSQLEKYIYVEESDKTSLPVQLQVSADKKTVQVQPKTSYKGLTSYQLHISNSLKSIDGAALKQASSYTFHTAVDDRDKFPRISEEELLQKVQKQTFAFFWDYAHPHSGMIRERHSSGETVTIGGTGFGVMAILVAVERQFITRTQGLERLNKIVHFLQNADTYHGAFSHWYHGATGKTIPFSPKDDGADLVETALLFQGLLAAREYFQDATLTQDINTLYQAVEWNFFQQGQDVLYWHWSPTQAWAMNLKISGWNESLLVYVLAAGSTNYSISKNVYDAGWARNGAMKNGKSFYNYDLPLGADLGGPLFVSQYSFLGINPTGLKDAYADYELQTKNHTLINRAYSIENPKQYYGYSSSCWGLTAGDIPTGYGAQSPSNDIGVIAPTAALSSMAFTPNESKEALSYFYYKLGDKIWGEYGFKDGFSLDQLWFADSYIAIDQGPIIIGIENYRSQLIWKQVMKAAEIKNGLKKLGFTSPNL